MPENKSLPKPLTDLPTPEKDLPLPEKEIPAHASEPEKTHKPSLILKSFLLGTLFVILIILIGGGVFILGKNSKSNQQVTVTKVSTPSPSPQQLSNTYKNEEFSFSFPEETFVLTQEVCSNASPGPSLVEKNPSNKYKVACVLGIVFDVSKVEKLDSTISNTTCYSTTKDRVSIDGIETDSYTTKFIGAGIEKCTEGYMGNFSQTSKRIYVNKGGQLYQIRWLVVPRVNQTAYDQILSTFKFTDTAAANPTGAMVACTQEAKLCPDGVTSVGRSGPNCEFEKCPGE